jgi:putative membrane protein
MHRELVITAALVLGCGTNESVPTPDAGQVADAASEASSSALDDAQIVGALHALNEGEVQEGQLAAASAVRPDVVSFANQMVTDHSSADASLTQPAAESAISEQLRAKTSQDLATLRAQSASFDAAYVSLQVAGHEAALALIDMVLARTADPTLADELRAARDLVTGHLAHANALAQAIGGGAQ